MGSTIWRVKSERVGALEPFSSEFEMANFLKNNPYIICGGQEESEESSIFRLHSERTTRKGSGDLGRIDLVGLKDADEERYLMIIELKNGIIKMKAVNQLDEYIKGWDKEASAKSEILSWLNQDLNLSKNEAERLIKMPRGLLIGTSFEPDALILARKRNLLGIKITRYSAAGKEYYVVLEDQIGEVVAVLDPKLESVALRYDQIADEGYRTNGSQRSYRQIQPPNWPKGIHYEFMPQSKTIGAELHIENERFRPLLSSLEAFKGRIISDTSVVLDPKWRRSHGGIARIRVILSKGVSDDEIAGAMKTLIGLTHSEVSERLKALG